MDCTILRDPPYSQQIIAAAKTSFLKGDKWAYSAGIIAMVAGAALIAAVFPGRRDEERLLEQYAAGDSARRPRAELA